LDDVILRLDRLEELLRAVTGDLRDIKAQQSALGVSLIRLEQQVRGPGDGASMLHVSNPPESLALATGNASIAPPPLEGREHDNAWCWG
jgi:hypothetical protein